MGALLEKVDTKEELADMIQRLGSPISAALLNMPCSIFRVPHIDGIIGYQLFGNCAIVISDPICLPQDREELTHSFHLYCLQSKKNILYLLTSDSFAHWAIGKECQTLIQAGEAVFLDPTRFAIRQKLRWKINQSIHDGVEIKEYHQQDASFEKQMDQTIAAWINKRHGPQIYLGAVPHYSNKRIFCALRKDQLVGLLSLMRIDRFQGWVVSYFLSIQDHPVGITEHLISTAIETLAHENCHFVCLGVVAGAKMGEMVGVNPVFQYFSRFIFKITKRMFHLDARQNYLNKFHPTSYPTYVLCSGKLNMSEILALKKILNVSIWF